MAASEWMLAAWRVASRALLNKLASASLAETRHAARCGMAPLASSRLLELAAGIFCIAFRHWIMSGAKTVADPAS